MPTGSDRFWSKHRLPLGRIIPTSSRSTTSLTHMDAEPYFDSFRPDSRFRALLQRMNLSSAPILA